MQVKVEFFGAAMTDHCLSERWFASESDCAKELSAKGYDVEPEDVYVGAEFSNINKPDRFAKVVIKKEGRRTL